MAASGAVGFPRSACKRLEMTWKKGPAVCLVSWWEMSEPQESLQRPEPDIMINFQRSEPDIKINLQRSDPDIMINLQRSEPDIVINLLSNVICSLVELIGRRVELHTKVFFKKRGILTC